MSDKMIAISQTTIDVAFVLLAQDLVREIKEFWSKVEVGNQEQYDNQISIIDGMIDAITELREQTQVFRSYLDSDLLDKEWVRADIKWHSPKPKKEPR